MTEVTSKTPKVWLIAAICGVLAFLALMMIAGYSTAASVIVGVLVAALVAILLWIGWYEDETVATEGHPEAEVSAQGLMATTGIGDEPAASAADEIAPAPHAADTREVISEGAFEAAEELAETDADAVDVESEQKSSLQKAADEQMIKVAPAPAGGGVATEVEMKPQFMDAPNEGGADNLKEIKGVGPKLETLLNEMGIYHFSQIAAWGEAEVAWMDSNLKGFKGRVTRDDWVAQATTLAAGGETEFSKRVEDGDVY